MSRDRRARKKRYELRDSDLNRALEELVAQASVVYGESKNPEAVRQILVTAMRLMKDGASAGDLKLVNSALKEMRQSFRVFAPYAAQRKVAVFGSARTEETAPEYAQARDFAEAIVKAGWMVITGAGSGIMEAAQGGAGRSASFGVNIRLPFEQVANDVIQGDHKLINFRYFFTRKVSFVKEAHAIVLFPGGFGTHDEGFEALTLIQTGKSEILPVVFIDHPGGSYWKDWERWIRAQLWDKGLISEEDLSLFAVTDDVGCAIREVLNFYSNYHSSRFVGDQLLLRVNRPPDEETLERLNDEFAGLLVCGAIDVCGPQSGERDEAPGLARVRLRFDRRQVGRLRQLIDRINELVPEPASSPQMASPHEILERPLSQEAEVAEEQED